MLPHSFGKVVLNLQILEKLGLSHKKMQNIYCVIKRKMIDVIITFHLVKKEAILIPMRKENTEYKQS